MRAPLVAYKPAWATIAVGVVVIAATSAASAHQSGSRRLDDVVLQLARQGGISLMFLEDLGQRDVPEALMGDAEPDEARTLLRDLLQLHGLRLLDGPAHTMVVAPTWRRGLDPVPLPARALDVSRCGEARGRQIHLSFRNINLEDFILTMRSLVDLPLDTAFGSGPTLTLAGSRSYTPAEVCQLLEAVLSFAELQVVERDGVFDVVPR